MASSSGGGIVKAKPLRHVYKTGASGCGGKSGPTSAKNSGAPLPCPFCDRIFKQDGRLKEHLKNKHADGTTDGLLANGDSYPVQPDTAGVGGGATDFDQGQAQQQSSYPIKTPKTLLHEWCQKNKRPVPKFKHVEEDGGFRCRVILPDAKKSEADVILWYRDTPTRSSQEAQHRAAVVGLHHVLGNRRLDRILADEYRQQWHNLDLAAEKRKAYLKANPRQLRPKPAPLPRELHSVFMSENNRRLVEGLLRGHENDDDTTSGRAQCQSDDASQRSVEPVELMQGGRIEPSPSSQPKVKCEDSWEKLEFPSHGIAGIRESSRECRATIAIQAVRRKLLSLGFTARHVNVALVERHNLPSALDWLILNVPEQELPTKFAPEASKASVQVLVRGKQTTYNEPSNLDHDTLSRLQEYGYAFSDCVTALSKASGDVEMALCSLFQSAFDDLRPDAGNEDISRNIAELVDIKTDEELALQGIFGGAVVLVSESLSVFEVAIPENLSASLKMEVRITPGSLYPFEVPVIAFRSKEFPAEFLVDLTGQVVGKAAVSLGRPMIYDLVHLATELVQELIVKYMEPTADALNPGNSLTCIDATQCNDKEMTLSSENWMVPNLQTLGRCTGARDNQPAAKAYIPPALRNMPSSTLLQSRDQQEVGLENIQCHVQVSGKINTAFVGVDVTMESAKLKMEWEQLRTSGRHGGMWSVRSKLPAFQHRDYVLSALNAHQVTIVAGQTGCGKSTQVPQYVLEDYIERDKGALCNIICTQPRRLSAIGLADRVSKERGQVVGETVGYTVRLESNRSQRTRLLFCTTGILLRRLLSDPDLKGVTHIVVDEVHERSLDSDLLLLLLREVIKRVGGGLRLILMSATVDTTLFVNYFRQEVQLDPCVVSIPGFTFPVQELYLEDALDLTGYKVDRNSRYATKKRISSSDLLHLSSPMESACVVSEDMDNWESLAEDKGKEQVVAMDMYSEATRQSLSIVDQSLINYDLIELLICAILQGTLPSKLLEPLSEDAQGHRGKHTEEGKQTGAVLVFLPGVAEIRRLQKQLQSSSQIASSHLGSLWVLALHGSLSSDEQRRVFSRPLPGSRKIVLATNIAETSVTIDDVVYVVDSGRHKEMRYDHSRGISCLEETWVSKASAKQRRGRAGRVQPGYCIRLYSRQHFRTFEDQQLPEILRVSLDGLCLKVKSLLAEKVEVVASKIITPPELGAVQTSLRNLQDLNALDGVERLTPLGHHLARMPVDVRVGKMLLFGCMLRCLDPVVTIAAALSGRTPFLSPLDKREETSAARLKFAGTSKSDHLTLVGAYNGWLSAKQEGRNAESNYCTTNFLSREALVGIEASRQDFFKILADIGFLPGSSNGLDASDVTELDSNASSIRVVKAVICAGFYPNIVRVLHPEKTYVQTEGGTVAKVAAARELRFFTKADGRVFLHPASVNFSVGKFDSPWLVFSEKMKTSKVFLKDSTMVPAYGLLLFGGKVQVKHEKQAISVDDWLEFEAPARIAVLIKELRAKVDSLLFEKIEKPALDISCSPVVSALIRLLTTDGF